MLIDSDSSYCCIYKREAATDILRHLVSVLADQDDNHLQYLDWKPLHEIRSMLKIGEEAFAAYGVEGLSRDSITHTTLVKRHLNIQIRLETEWCSESDDCVIVMEEGICHVGWYDLHILAGERYVRLEMVTSAEKLADVMLYSEQMQQMWRDFAKRSNAVLAYLETEVSAEQLLYPVGLQTIFPDINSLSFEDAGIPGLSVDHFTNYVLAHLKPAAPEPLVVNRRAEIDAEWDAMVADLNQRLSRWNPFRKRD